MASNRIESLMLEHFFNQMPFVEDEMVYCYRSGPNEMTAVLRDGSRAIFNDLFCTTQFISKLNSESVDDKEWSRRFGRRLRYLMNDRRVTQKELSDRTGISQSNISNYIRGASVPKVTTVTKLAWALGCSVSDLTSYCEEPTY